MLLLCQSTNGLLKKNTKKLRKIRKISKVRRRSLRAAEFHRFLALGPKINGQNEQLPVMAALVVRQELKIRNTIKITIILL